jgi:hypothetical protein
MRLKHFLLFTLSTLFLTGCSVAAFNQDEQNAAQNQNRNAQNYNKSLPDPSANLPRKTEVKPVANGVCPNPNAACQHKNKKFAEWELSFKMPAKILPNKPYRSAQFYAVLLKANDVNAECDGGEFIEAVEEERKKIQSYFSERKVFTSYNCPNFTGRMSADGERIEIDNFIAVYAGYTEAEAKEVIAFLRENVESFKEDYPKAQIKKMTAVWESIEQ